MWGEKEGSEKGASLVPCHRLGTALCVIRGLPWCSPWLLGTGLLRLAGWLCPQQRSSPQHLRLELAEEQTEIWGAPAWPWSGTQVLERWVGSFPLLCSPWAELCLGPSQCWCCNGLRLLPSVSLQRKIMPSGNLWVCLCEWEGSVEKWSPSVQLALSGSAALLHLSDSGIKAAQIPTIHLFWVEQLSFSNS